MAAPRLRKTFHYPADDSEEDDTPEGLDEEGMISKALDSTLIGGCRN